MSFLRKIGVFSMCAVLMAVSIGAVSVSAQTGRISCSSIGDGYNYCRVDTENRVRLVRQMSSRYCDQGSSWGYDRRGIWVDRGCRAEFEYGKGVSSTGAAVGGAVLGGVLLAAIIASNRHKNENKDSNGDNSYEMKRSTPPNWLIGSFRGYDRTGSFDVTIYDDGRVWSAGNRQSSSSSGTYYKGDMYVNGQTYKITRVFNGFEARQTSGNNSEVITFDRTN